MDEDLSIINSNNRNQKIKDFFINNKKIFLGFITFILIILITFFIYTEYKDTKKNKISNFYNLTIIEYEEKKK